MNGLTILEAMADKPATASPPQNQSKPAAVAPVIDCAALRDMEWTPEMFHIAATKMGQRGKGIKKPRTPQIPPASA